MHLQRVVGLDSLMPWVLGGLTRLGFNPGLISFTIRTVGGCHAAVRPPVRARLRPRTLLELLMTTSVPAPMLRDGVEKIVGLEGMTLLHDTGNGTYHRISDLASRIIDLFDGTRSIDDIADMINDCRFQGPRIGPEHVETLTRGLMKQQLLVGGTPRKRRRTGFDRMLPRFLLTTGFAGLLDPLVSALRPWYRTAPVTIAVLTSLLGYALGLTRIALAGMTRTAFDPEQTAIAALAALPIQLLAILLHESWHGIVAGLHDQPVRGLGVALMFWIIPVAYVDRTDAYRLRDRRLRVAIALAGMVNDGWVMGLTAVVAAWSTGLTHQVAGTLAGYQLILLLANLNPLAPSDSVSAVEAVTGEVDLRGRARTMLVSTLLHRPLLSYLSRLSTPRRTLYLWYGVLSHVFAVWIIASAAWSIWNGILTAARGVPR